MSADARQFFWLSGRSMPIMQSGLQKHGTARAKTKNFFFNRVQYFLKPSLCPTRSPDVASGGAGNLAMLMRAITGLP
jgi:hypothetical protein